MEYNMTQWGFKIQRYFYFSEAEIRNILITIILLSSLVGFDDGQAVFQWSFWLRNYINTLIVVALAVIVHLTVQRIWALKDGYRVDYNLGMVPMVLAIIFFFASGGKIWFLAMGGISFTMLETHRLGYFRYQVSVYEQSISALMGNIANIILAFIFIFFYRLWPSNPLIERAIWVNLAYAISNMAPIPPLDGTLVFMWKWKILYFMSWGWMIGIAVVLKLFFIFHFGGWTFFLLLLGSLVFAFLFNKGVGKIEQKFFT